MTDCHLAMHDLGKLNLTVAIDLEGGDKNHFLKELMKCLSIIRIVKFV
ncbi:TPA: hypothetical protein ACF418_000567 [Streptococcus pyogenes]|nr:hypothetical protein [Streptococcus pyogenes]HER0007906.1 hypothetical protein [Streptococcus pyogenes]HER0844487.1 hypothetical protein [Streptococcus pyogenes]HER1363594.1 hypothetical protein [Streptococcus pyogenes]HER1396165.1 hypothetical protein [Streptococcus pyogenes]HER8845585.1 hypothetical protein [Streptococcus pyogenes]